MKIYSFRKFRFFISIALFAMAIIAASRALSDANQSTAVKKIAPWVLQQTANGNQAEFLVVLENGDLKGANALRTKAEKGRFVRDTLWNKAQATQGPLLTWLRQRSVEHRSYYIVNLIWVKGDATVAQALAARPDVVRIEGNPQIRNIPNPLPAGETPNRPEATTAVEPGISHTRAPEVWAMGYTGQGIVVAGADTGYLWDHTALKNHYRGWDGNAANHNYNWHDSIHAANLSCAADPPHPCDDNGHGTHTIGTAVGDDAIANQIGMAPGAKWIGCRNMNAGNGTPATYIECMEFFLAPYPLGGTPAQGDPSKAPDISTNSWSCPPSEGCSADSLQAAVEAQRAAGIMMIVAAANAGPNCSTVSDPPGIYDAAYSIGALTTGSDSIASFSGRGPVTLDGSNRPKPDLSAPGTSTRSSSNTTILSYASLSGTSMATPHVAGAVALLWSAQSSLRNDVAATETVLNESAVHISSNACSSSGSPNNTYGHGRLDIKAAVDRALLLKLVGAVSRKTHPGAGTFDIDLPLASGLGVECRSSSGNHTLVFTFNNNVVSGTASVTSGTGTVSGSPVFSGRIMTVNLSGVADVQKITVTLSGVTDNLSQVLPATAVSMGVLPGDINGNKAVSNTDVAEVKGQVSTQVTASNFRNDMNANGVVSNTDVGATKAQVSTALP